MVANNPLTIKDIAGSEASNRAITAIFDAFGFRQASPPRRRSSRDVGAMLGRHTEGGSADLDWFPTDTEEKARA